MHAASDLMSEVQLDPWAPSLIPQDERDQPQLCQHPHRCNAVHRVLSTDPGICIWRLPTDGPPALASGQKNLFAQLARVMQQTKAS